MADRVRSIIYGPPDRMAAFVMYHRLQGNKALASEFVREFQITEERRVAPETDWSPTTWAFLELSGEFRGWGTSWPGKDGEVEASWRSMTATIENATDEWNDDNSLPADDDPNWQEPARLAINLSYETMVVDLDNDDTQRETSMNHDGWLGITIEIIDGFGGRDKKGTPSDEAVHGGRDTESSVLGGSGE